MNTTINNLRLSLITMYVLTSIHHVYGGLADGIASRLMVPVLGAIPLVAVLVLLNTYGRTRSTLALNGALVVTVVFFVILLGVVHSAYSHVYKDILYLLNGSPELYFRLNPDEHYPPDDLFFELTGISEAVVALFVTRYAVQLVQRRNAVEE
jgi:hypothetical protein